MADIYDDGMTRVSWVPSIANTAAPTTTELTAGVLLQSILTGDGLIGFEPDTQGVDTTSLASTQDTEVPGSDKLGGCALRLKKQSGTDTAYTTLTRNAVGFIAIRRDTAQATAWTSNDPVEVYPVACGTTKKLKPERNTVSRYEIPLFVTGTANVRAAVA